MLVTFWVLKGQFHKNKIIIKLYHCKNKVKIINFTHISYINSCFRYIFIKFCTINRSCVKLKNHKSCQLYKNVHKVVKSFKKLGLGTPPLKKREKKMFSFVTGWRIHKYLMWHHKQVLLLTSLFNKDSEYKKLTVRDIFVKINCNKWQSCCATVTCFITSFSVMYRMSKFFFIKRVMGYKFTDKVT